MHGLFSCKLLYTHFSIVIIIIRKYIYWKYIFQLNKIGKNLCQCIKDPHDRLDLANVLDSGHGYNGYNLCTGLVRMALEDLLNKNSGGNEVIFQ